MDTLARHAAPVAETDDQFVYPPVETVTRGRELRTATGCDSAIDIEQASKQFASLALTAAEIVRWNMFVVQDPHGAKSRLDASMLGVADLATPQARARGPAVSAFR